ncbi:hypothetical protein CSC70_06725 [Pseudoxanthomonas kalamensis DSM 18571]|uniref:tetratricopeptide repeat protein n=1 Tax=Pseudoxanthomonas kalamensis TaxID=289483 RepID=UPI0013914407|nr:tetratricopeptide repeat protein [Pseudoxanthomonas kalamensis]KAF1710372.1 hypothetical protein CSC70_06725 [Pseudoxanthomonas kalamensis DSM 18571]
MSPVLILSIALQVACCVHVVRTGRPLYWIFILLLFSYIAVAIYFLAEVLPDLRNGLGSRKVARKMRNALDPKRDKRRAESNLKLADTQENRRELAAESLKHGDFDRAAELYASALKGMYATDPDLLLGLAKAQFGMGQTRQTRETLDALIAANPEFRSKDGHLLYARAVEESGDLDAALHEYEAVVQGFPGEEARLRYGLLLKRCGKSEQAVEVFNEILTRSAVSPGYYQRDQREWTTAARKELAALES